MEAIFRRWSIQMKKSGSLREKDKKSVENEKRRKKWGSRERKLWAVGIFFFRGGSYSRKHFHATFKEERKLEAKLAWCLSEDCPGMVLTISFMFSLISFSFSFFYCFWAFILFRKRVLLISNQFFFSFLVHLWFSCIYWFLILAWRTCAWNHPWLFMVSCFFFLKYFWHDHGDHMKWGFHMFIWLLLLLLLFICFALP